MSFRAINLPSPSAQAPPRGTPELEDSDIELPDLPDPWTFVNARGARPANAFLEDEASNICDREWPVAEIIDKIPRADQILYHVRWDDEVVLAKDIRRDTDGSQYIKCDSKDWKILGDEPSPPDNSGRSQRTVKWKETSWRAENELTNARECIQKYEEKLRQESERLPGSPSSNPTRVVSLHPHEERLEGSDVSNTALRTSDVKSYGIMKGLLFAEDGVDYSSILRDWARLNGSGRPQQGKLLKNQAVRPLMIRPEFDEKGKALDINRPERCNALLATDSGYEQLSPCDRCSKGCGPCTTCVVSTEFQNLPCTNCISDRKPKECNFHIYAKNGVKRRKARLVDLDITRQPPSPHASSSQPTLTTGSTLGSSIGLITPGSTHPSSPLQTSSLHAPLGGSKPSPELGSTPLKRRFQGSTQTEGTQEIGVQTPPEEINMPQGADQSRQLSPNLQDLDIGRAGQSVVQTLRLSPVPEPAINRGMKRPRSSTDDSGAPRIKRPSATNSTHMTCVGGHATCTDPAATFRIEVVSAGPSQTAGTVYKNMLFGESEATAAQVRFIVNQSNCVYTDFFEKAWQLYNSDAVGTTWSCVNKEAFLSKWLYGFLNGAVLDHCPEHPGGLATRGTGRTAEDAIVIE